MPRSGSIDLFHALEDYQQQDVLTLIELFTSQDPRGIEQMIAEDPVTEHVVEKAAEWTEGEYQQVEFDGAWVTCVKGPEVKAGDTIGFFQHGDANGRHGWSLNGEVIEYETPFQRFAKRMEMLAGFDRNRREQADEMREVMAEWVGELEGPYKARIERFRAQSPDFDVEGGGYEVYPVVMAQRIERHCREHGITADEFHDLPYEEQKPVIHAGKPDTYGISGHQFGMACVLARAVMAGGDI